MSIKDIITNRYSPRAFSSKEVEPEKIHDIFELTVWAPSAYNAQPWKFIYATKKDTDSYNKILETMTDFNKSWAKNAPVLLLGLTAKKFKHNGKDNPTSQYDLGQSVAYLTLAASESGLHLHQMSGFSSEKAIELFDIPEEYIPVSIIALGYKGELSVLPEDLQKMENGPRTRKSLDEVFQKKGFK